MRTFRISQVKTILALDKQALQVAKDELAAMGSSADPAQRKAVEGTQARIEAQVAKLAALKDDRVRHRFTDAHAACWWRR